jgi:hypothetical protein
VSSSTTDPNPTNGNLTATTAVTYCGPAGLRYRPNQR